MPETHDIGRVFVHFQRLVWNAPPYHRAPTVELDEPYRRSRSFVLHLWPTTLGLVFGRWSEPDPDRTDDDAVIDALDLHAGPDPQIWEEGVSYRPSAPPRDWQTLVAQRDENGETEVLFAPKFTLIDEALLPYLDRWHGHENLVKIGKYRYWLHGHHGFATLAVEAERVDRRNPLQFLFGGARPWD